MDSQQKPGGKGTPYLLMLLSKYINFPPVNYS